MSMVLTILGLLSLVLITPNLLGRPPELASIPLLIVGLSMDESAFIVDVSSAVSAYLYSSIRLEIRSVNTSYNATVLEPDTYDVHTRVPAAEAPIAVHTILYDRQDNVFEYNVTARISVDDLGRTIMVVTLIDEPNDPEERRLPPDDFRALVPRRDTP